MDFRFFSTPSSRSSKKNSSETMRHCNGGFGRRWSSGVSPLLLIRPIVGSCLPSTLYGIVMTILTATALNMICLVMNLKRMSILRNTTMLGKNSLCSKIELGMITSILSAISVLVVLIIFVKVVLTILWIRMTVDSINLDAWPNILTMEIRLL